MFAGLNALAAGNGFDRRKLSMAPRHDENACRDSVEFAACDGKVMPRGLSNNAQRVAILSDLVDLPIAGPHAASSGTFTDIPAVLRAIAIKQEVDNFIPKRLAVSLHTPFNPLVIRSFQVPVTCERPKREIGCVTMITQIEDPWKTDC